MSYKNMLYIKPRKFSRNRLTKLLLLHAIFKLTSNALVAQLMCPLYSARSL